MADGFIPRKSPTTTDQKIDTEEVVHGGNTVQRERVLFVDGVSADPIAAGVHGTDGGTNNAVKVCETPQASNTAQGTVSVLESSTTLLASRATRKSVVFVNEGTQNVRLSGAATALVTDCLLQPGSTFSDDSYVGGYTAISESGTVDVSYFEVYS